MQSKVETKRPMLNCDVSKETRAIMNEHIAKRNMFQYAFIDQAILEKVENDTITFKKTKTWPI